MKTVLNPVKVLDAQTLAATVTKDLPELFAYYGLAIQINFSQGNNCVGSLKLQVSIDDVNFVDYAPFTAITSFTSSALFFLDDKMFPFKDARLVYTRTSGTGTMDVWVAGVRI